MPTPSPSLTSVFGSSNLLSTDMGATIGIPRNQTNTGGVPPIGGNTIVLIGSSTIARCIDNLAAATGYPATGFWTYAQARLGNRLTTLGVLGVSGETSDQTLARFPTATVLRPAYILVLTGMNDVLNGVSAATIQSNLSLMANAAIAAGATPIILTLNPLDSGTTTITAAQTLVLQQVNMWLKTYLAQRTGIIVIDTYSVLSNGTTGNYVSTPVSFTVDGTHHSAAGSAACGRRVWEVLAPLIPVVDQLPIANNQGNLISLNPMMTGTAGTKGTGGDVVSGSVPDSWTVSSNGLNNLVATCSVAARTDGIAGQLCTVIYTSGGNMRYGQSGIAPGGSTYQIGDTIEAICEVDCLSDLTLAGPGFKFEAVTATSGAINYTSYGQLIYTTTNLTSDNMRCYKSVFRTPAWVVPATTNQVSVRFETQAPGTYIIGRMCVRKVTPA